MTLPIRATLLGIQFHGWTGWVPSRQPMITSFSRVGQDGSGSEITGTRSEPKDYSAWIAVSSQTEAKDKARAIEDLCGQVGALLDPWGRSIAKMRVTKARAVPRAAKGSIISGTTPATHVVVCEFELEPLP